MLCVADSLWNTTRTISLSTLRLIWSWKMVSARGSWHCL